MQVLISDIVSGRLGTGELLPRETDLADQFGVSRGVARECVRGLEERGLVSVKHGRGATVNGEGRWSAFDPDILAARLDGEEAATILGEILECRQILEIAAVGVAAERATTKDLAELSHAFARMTASAERAHGNPAAEDLYHEADIAFHRALIAATGNRILGNITEPVHRAFATARKPLARPDRRIERSLPEHQRIMSAVARRDPEAARTAMRDHLATIEEYLREYELARAERHEEAGRAAERDEEAGRARDR
jgi:GntR family transcriptional repressor for pyruvate dehydrogenase complex